MIATTLIQTSTPGYRAMRLEDRPSPKFIQFVVSNVAGTRNVEKQTHSAVGAIRIIVSMVNAASVGENRFRQIVIVHRNDGRRKAKTCQ